MKKKDFLWSMLSVIVVSLLSISFMSCGGDDDDSGGGGSTPTLTIAPAELTLSANAGASGTIAISASGQWFVTCNETWISLSQENGTGAGAVVVTATEGNPQGTVRSATITVRSGTNTKYATIKQEASETLIVSGLDAPFDASAGSIQSAQDLVITCNAAWTISGKPDWLDISALSGNGTSTVKIWTNKDNNSTTERSATLTISSGSKSVSKIVIQRAGLDEKLKVAPNSIVTLADGYAFDYDFGSNVKYYYVASYLPANIDRKTDDEIIAEMSSDSSNRDTPSDGYVTSWSNLRSQTEYIVCTVGYDQNGKHGALIKTSITTKSGSNQAVASISNVQYDDTYWHWTTSVNGFVTKYYQWFVTRTDLYSASDATIAWFFNDAMKKNPGNFSPIVQGDTWRSARNGGTMFHVVTWAVDVSGNFSGLISNFYGSINSSQARVINKHSSGNGTSLKRVKTYK